MAKTENEIVLETCGEIAVGLRIFFFRREEGKEIELRNFFPRMQNGEREFVAVYPRSLRA